MTATANPFRIWASLARGLHTCVMQELTDKPYSPSVARLLSMIQGLATHCHHLSLALADLERRDQKAYAGFLRALDRAAEWGEEKTDA